MTSCATIRSFWLFGALLMLADALSTWYALQLGLQEANPSAVWMMDRIGIANDLILKVLVCVPVVWGMARLTDWGIRRGSHFIRNAGIVALVSTVAFMTAIVTNNVTLIVLTLGGNL